MDFYLRPETSYLRISGPHQVDFLQRQTTNDVKSLVPGRSILSVLTTPTARILDVFTLFLDDIPGTIEPAICAIGLPGRAPATTDYLKHRIFFMDRVSVENASGEFVQIDLLGPDVELSLHDLGLPSIPQSGEILQAEIASCGVRVFGKCPGASLGYRLVYRSQGSDAILKTIESRGYQRLEREAYEVRRVEAGLPSGEGELTEEYNPLEIGLQGGISSQKGCYTGQEVIARQITYEKVTRRLVGLSLEASVAKGYSVIADGKPVGMITSVADSPAFGPIALAILRRPAYESGKQVLVNGDGNQVYARVVPLPFGS